MSGARLTMNRDRHGRVLYRWHPAGYTIWRQEVEEDRRGWTPRGSAGVSCVGPKVWWEVRRYGKRQGAFDTLREAREWCDAHACPKCGLASSLLSVPSSSGSCSSTRTTP